MEDNKQFKTADYTRRAMKNYRREKDIFSITTKQGLKDRIKTKYGNTINISAYIEKLIEADLNKATTGENRPVKNPFET